MSQKAGGKPAVNDGEAELAERRPITNRIMRAASRQSRLTSRTGVTAWARDLLLRAVSTRLATRRLAALWHV
jgi:hypothetical protein